MKLVIEVPDQIVDMVCNTGTYGYYRFNSTKAIKKGIPLDKVIKDIKEEISEELNKSLNNWMSTQESTNAYKKVLEIIDKYRGESKV